jgi:hypothetical protein
LTVELNEPLREVLSILRRAYPTGLPLEDYFPLLVVLQEDMSEAALSSVVAALTGGEAIVIGNDAAAAVSVKQPQESEVERVRHHLTLNGWEPELPPET